MNFEKMLERYMQGVIDDDHVVANPERHTHRGLSDEEIAHLLQLYRTLLDREE